MRTLNIHAIACAGLATAGILCFGGKAQAQPGISAVFPNGAYMFQNSAVLTFSANSPLGITNVSVDLTATSLHTGQAILKNLTAANGLTISGPNTAYSVSALLKSNTLYSATIQVKDANGAATSQTVTFDTIVPAYTWEMEDWDFTRDGTSGRFIDNPQTNAYAGLLTTDNVDAHNGNGPSPYRIGGDAGGGGLSTETCGDQSRQAYMGTGKTDYDVGYTDGGDFGNFTRHYPAGTYNLFVRISGGNGPRTEAADLSVVAGGAVISSPSGAPYKIATKGRGWQTYDFMPVTDTAGNLVEITFDSNPSTLQVMQNQGNDNINFFLLVPLQPVLVSSTTITNVFPDGAAQFQATNRLSFDATSSVAINPASDVSVVLTATNLLGKGSVQSLTTANGLTITGGPTNIHVSAPLASNMVYTAFIQVSDANGVPASFTVSFDTITPAYTFEAEDFNYNGGLFFDNPQMNAYNSFDGQTEVDFHRNNSGGNSGYNRIGLPGEGCNDVPRLAHAGFPDYDLGNTSSGNWANYTRTFPAAVYNIFVRVSRGDGNPQANAGKVSLVNGDRTQPDQVIQDLGSHGTPSTGGWQKYVWMPVMNSGGSPARFIADGTAKTLRYTFVGAGENLGFILLMPADLSVSPPPFVSDFTPTGPALFQVTNGLSFVANSSVGISTNNITVNLNGLNMTGLKFNGSSTAWTVTCPVKTNVFYTAIITLNDTAGTTISTNTFDTFDRTSVISFETEDFNYANGQFIDNPAIDAFNGLNAVSGVDYFSVDGQHGNAYNREGLTTENCGDVLRSDYSAGSYSDYSIGFNSGGNWANYTRTIPAGIYNVYLRAACPNDGGSTDAFRLSRVTSDRTLPGQTTASLGTFSPPGTGGWQTYTWVPLKDAGGNLAQIVADGSALTLRETVMNGNANINFFLLVPVDASMPSSVGNFQPDGTGLFQFANTMTFTVTSPAGVVTNNIMVRIDGVLVTNLTFSGNSNVWNIICPVTANAGHTAIITVMDANGTIHATNNFNTFNAADYQVEAEDYDYNGGSHFDAVVGAYVGLGALVNVDTYQSHTGNGSGYRLDSLENPAPATGTSGDQVRTQFTSAGKTDYCIGNFETGSWNNYTRQYPVGTYNVIGRFAEGAGPVQASLLQVTSGIGSTSQSIETLGTFAVPLTGWGSWGYVTLMDSTGNPSKVELTGVASTLRLVNDGPHGVNVNFFMLVPTTPQPKLAAKVIGGNISISFLAQTGYSYQLQYKTSLTDAVWLPLGIAVAGNDTVKSLNDTPAGGNRFYRIQVQ